MCTNPTFLRSKNIYVRCNKCVECVTQHSKEWSWRICYEARQYPFNCMLTLTYNESCLPKGDTLVKRDLQLFMKRLRKKVAPLKIRFFACGEYGDLHGRPHYHIIIFGYDFIDKKLFFVDKQGVKTYRSKILESLWTFGFSSVIDFTEENALYCANYLQQVYTPPNLSIEDKERVLQSLEPFDVDPYKVLRQRGRQPYFLDGRLKPFVQMSRRSGIGCSAYNDSWLATNKMYKDGHYMKLPRFYWNLRAKEVGDELAQLERKALTENITQANIDKNVIENKIYKLKEKFGTSIDERGRLVISRKKHEKN